MCYGKDPPCIVLSDTIVKSELMTIKIEDIENKIKIINMWDGLDALFRFIVKHQHHYPHHIQ